MKLGMVLVLVVAAACGSNEPSGSAAETTSSAPAHQPAAAAPADPAASAPPAAPTSDAQRFVLELIETLKADDADRWRANLSTRLRGRDAATIKTQMAAWKELLIYEEALRTAQCREESADGRLHVACDISPKPIKLTVVREDGALRLDEN